MTIINRSDILRWTEPNIQRALNATGVYILRDTNQDYLYIGRNVAPRRLRERILDHRQSGEPPELRSSTGTKLTPKKMLDL